MDCVIHIGTEKTGTTSIQRTLDAEADRLAAQGVFWPPVLRDGQDTRIVCYALEDATIDLRKRRRKLTTPEVIATFRAQFEERFRREVRKAGDARTLLVVNEHLSRLREASELIRLRALLAPLCERIRVVVYLRRQDRLMRSMYAQVVKVGGTRENVFPRREDDKVGDFITFDYQRIVDLWAGVFGPEALTIRVYEPARLAGGDVVRDFFETAGIALPEGGLPARSNEGLAPEAIMALRLLNRHLPRAARGNLGPLAAEVLTGSGMPVARADAAGFLAHFEAGNDAVARGYLGRDHLFEPIGPQDYPEAVPPGALEVDAETVARIFARLWEAKIRRQ